MSHIKKLYNTDIKGKLKTDLKISNVMQIPYVTKVSLNMGIKDAVQSSKIVAKVAEDLSLIAGQKAIITYAKNSIAAFKLREGSAIGCKVTLRKDRMYSFLDMLVYVALPRVRDFEGFSKKSFDGNGNLSIGIREYIVFPEIDYDKIDKIRGMNIVINTSATNDKDGYALLKAIGIPFYN